MTGSPGLVDRIKGLGSVRHLGLPKYVVILVLVLSLSVGGWLYWYRLAPGYVAGHLATYGNRDRDNSQLDAMENVGLRSALFDVAWTYTPRRGDGTYDFTKYHRLLQDIRGRRMFALLILSDFPPNWVFDEYPKAEEYANDGERHPLMCPNPFLNDRPLSFHNLEVRTLILNWMFQAVNELKQYNDCILGWSLNHYYYPYSWGPGNDVLYGYSESADLEYEEWRLLNPEKDRQQFREESVSRWVGAVAETVKRADFTARFIFKTLSTNLPGNSRGNLGFISGINNKLICNENSRVIDAVGIEVYPYGLRVQNPVWSIKEYNYWRDEIEALQTQTDKSIMVFEFGVKGPDGNDMSVTDFTAYLTMFTELGVEGPIFLYTFNPDDRNFWIEPESRVLVRTREFRELLWLLYIRETFRRTLTSPRLI